ncbi:hypothetical protein ADL19_10275 [Streptomyces purpurogeneiscleroticus]|jgi:hypothetical protein|nr:hypothetical protein ADL19_10275 [Streptomyces purpurogeneiscleroticus]
MINQTLLVPLFMVSAAIVAFTPFLVEPFTAFMVTAIATFLHHGGTVAPALNLYPARVDVEVLRHGCRWREREYRRQQQNRRRFHCHRDLPCRYREY